MKYPRKWKNKTSGAEVRVMPWWETITDDGGMVEVDEMGKMISESLGKPCRFGVITQVGYLLENEHGVWFGMGPKAVECFEDLGEIHPDSAAMKGE